LKAIEPNKTPCPKAVSALLFGGIEMNWKDRITVDPNILVGKPIIRGTRISVELLMDRLSDGWSMEQILESYPRVTREDVLAALTFVTEVFREEDYIAIQKATA
jgi:uncharacterized protein (DUF433 family)